MAIIVSFNEQPRIPRIYNESDPSPKGSCNHPQGSPPMQLKGSKTEGNLKAAFAGESQANRRYLYFANKADIEGYNDVSPCSAPPRKAKPAMLTATWNTWPKSAIRPPACRSAPRRQPEGRDRQRNPRIHRNVSRAWPRPPATKASTKSPTGRDAGQGRAFARQPLPARAGRLAD